MVTARPNDAKLQAASADFTAEGDAAFELPEGEQTMVRARPVELYSVEVWRNGVRQAVVPITKQEISIGRGSKSVAVDLPLKNDPEVSRVHATLLMDEQGQFWLTPRGRNATMAAGRELPREEQSPVAPDQKVEICSYVLRIQPK